MLDWKVAPKVISFLLIICFSISLITGWISYQNGKRALEEFSFNKRNGTELKMRVGIHCGPVVAGVIGTTKFIYDLWGEIVNMASRMESTGIPNQIQVSENFYNEIKDKYKTELRGEITVKGAGQVKTYMLHGAVGT